MENKTFNFEDRLVEFAAKVIMFCKTLPKDPVGSYYVNQMLRSSGSAALHYGEAQGTTTDPDFIHKTSNVLKELRETRVSLKILDHASYGDSALRSFLISESGELSSISAKMILNKKQKNKN
ncbi:MAG TPA: four helix bundle protein [Saprospiraceae bacterium]|nr:four helix bundle protein [Saprospiraceae bacterium]